jgi:hypothetical protein
MRTARVNGGGKFPEAVAWAKDVSAFIEKRGYASGLIIYADAFGQVGTMRWMVDADDIATLEQAQMRISTDVEYFAKLREAGEQGAVPATLDRRCRDAAAVGSHARTPCS